MRKFVHGSAIKYTDNNQKANSLLSLGYVEVDDDGKAPNFDGHAADPRRDHEKTRRVEKGLHTLQEPTTDKVAAEAAEDVKAAAPASDKEEKEADKQEEKKKTAKKK